MSNRSRSKLIIKLKERQARLNSLNLEYPLYHESIQIGEREEMKNFWKKEGAQMVLKLTESENPDKLTEEIENLGIKDIQNLLIRLDINELNVEMAERLGRVNELVKNYQLIVSGGQVERIHLNNSDNPKWDDLHLIRKIASVLNSNAETNRGINKTLNAYWKSNPKITALEIGQGEYIFRPGSDRDVYRKYQTNDKYLGTPQKRKQSRIR